MLNRLINRRLLIVRGCTTSHTLYSEFVETTYRLGNETGFEPVFFCILDTGIVFETEVGSYAVCLARFDLGSLL